MSLIYKFPKFYDWTTKKILDDKELKKFQDDICPTFLSIDSVASGAIILDVACGTGRLALWIAQKRPDVHVLGIDISKAMVERAQLRAKEDQLKNVVFLHKEPLTMTAQDIVSCFAILNSDTPLDMIVCSHGYTAMKVREHESIFKHTLSLLKEGGSNVIMDIYVDKTNSLMSRFLRKFDSVVFGANGESQKYWLLLKDVLTDFEMKEVYIKQWGMATLWYIARGIKR